MSDPELGSELIGPQSDLTPEEHEATRDFIMSKYKGGDEPCLATEDKTNNSSQLGSNDPGDVQSVDQGSTCPECGPKIEAIQRACKAMHSCVEVDDDETGGGSIQIDLSHVPACDQGAIEEALTELQQGNRQNALDAIVRAGQELSRVTKERDRLRELADSRLKGWGEMHDERNELRAELEKARSREADDFADIHELCEQRDKLIAELEKVKEELFKAQCEIVSHNDTARDLIAAEAALREVSKERDNLLFQVEAEKNFNRGKRDALKRKLLATEAALREARDLLNEFPGTMEYLDKPIQTDLLDRVRDQLSNILKDEHCEGKARLMTMELLRLLGGE